MMHLPGPLVGVLSSLLSSDHSRIVFFELLCTCRGYVCAFDDSWRSDAVGCIYSNLNTVITFILLWEMRPEQSHITDCEFPLKQML